MNDQLKRVSRIGPPLKRMSFRCEVCQGTGSLDNGFAFGTNTSNVRRCWACRGACFVWVDVLPQTVS